MPDELPDPNQMTIEPVVPQQDAHFETLIKLCNHLEECWEARDKADRELEALKKKIEDLEVKKIPDLMNSIGISDLTLKSGKKIKLGEDVFASVSKERMEKAWEWLKEHKMDAIVTHHYIVSSDQARQLEEAGIAAQPVASIHPSRLRSFVRERISEEKPDTPEADKFPRELFGAHVVPRVTIKSR